MSAADAGAAVAAYGVNLIDEDNGGRIFLCLFEQVTDTGGTHAHEHLHEIRTGDGEERTACLAGNGSRQQGLTGSGRAHEQNAFRDACADLAVLPRIFQEVNDLLQLVLLLVGACHIGKRRLSGVHLVLDVRLSEGGVLAAAVCLPHHKDKQHDHHHDQQQRGDERQQPRRIRHLIIVLLQRCLVSGVVLLPIVLGIL